MKKIFPLIAATLMLGMNPSAGLTVPVEAAPTSARSVAVTPMAWGADDVSGLQLGVQQVANEPTLLGMTRNIGKQSVFYNVFPMNDWSG
ncbi:MAG: hypothetical protein ACR2MB_16560, partial [Acidimicrobiales bacterium]